MVLLPTIHDALHHHSYRLFCPMPREEASEMSFYRLQFGINFRRWNKQSYSAKDSVQAEICSIVSFTEVTCVSRRVSALFKGSPPSLMVQPEPPQFGLLPHTVPNREGGR